MTYYPLDGQGKPYEPGARLALLTAAGELHPLSLPGEQGCARTRLHPERFCWEAEGIFSLSSREPDGFECWQLLSEESGSPGCHRAERLSITISGSLR